MLSVIALSYSKTSHQLDLTSNLKNQFHLDQPQQELVNHGVKRQPTDGKRHSLIAKQTGNLTSQREMLLRKIPSSYFLKINQWCYAN